MVLVAKTAIHFFFPLKCNSDFKFCLLSAAVYSSFSVMQFAVLDKLINMHDIFGGKYTFVSSELAV